jgi:hypothetical protein
LNGLVQRQGGIFSSPPKFFKGSTLEDECGMDPQEIGFEFDDLIKGLEKTITGIPRKADHQLMSHLKPPLV